jgi:hypothetical protein
MPTTDLSIGQPSFVEFNYNGWPHEKKDDLEIAVRQIPGVVSVDQAGHRSSIRVHYNATHVGRDHLILTVNQVADQILPGYNFSGR